ncbi:MAG TPA: Pls/PosA family non-ribosomal peptide synthetase [Trebonia sp.]
MQADPEGLIYLGRADAQVKIRGYRIEPSEIEAAIMELPGIELATVTTHERLPGVVELVGYYTLRDHTLTNHPGPPDRQAIGEHLRNRLPRHMIPAYLEELPAMPFLSGGKVDRRSLPEPTSSGRFAAGQDYVPPGTPGELALANALAELLGLEQVSVDSQLFDDLGMSSLLVAHFCARVRERAEAPPLSVKDVYRHPTIRGLAAAVTGPLPVPGTPAGRRPEGCREPAPHATWLAERCNRWQTLIHANPLALFTGSPVYCLYLRALGAKIGRRVIIFSTTVPVCTDMLAIGDDTVIRKESTFSGYRAVAGVIRTGPVSIGREALIGEHTVLDIGTSVGDRSQLGHTSSLQESQAVPDGQHWHGSPAQRTDVDYRSVAAIPCGPLRRTVHGSMQVLSLVFVTLPLAAAVGVAGLTKLPAITSLAALGAGGLTGTDFYEDGLLVSTVLFCGALLAGAAVVVVVPRMLRRFVTPGRAYPLYGLRHSAHRAIRLLTNIEFYLELLGDSSYVVHYLRGLGYRLPDFEQSGSNFGADLEHETPFLVVIGRGTMIADGATLIDADYSSTSFQVMPLSIGPGNFLGNAVAYPAGGRVGENCLIATKAMVPLSGPVRDNVGLLGSPCFEIPRSATTDDRFDHLRTGEEFRRRLRAKNRHNVATMGLFLAVRWVHIFVVTLFAMAAWELYRGNPVLVLAGLTVATLLFTLAFFITVERALLRFGPLRPRYCSIYDPYFWWHERYWKLMAPLVGMFDGTPFKGPVWRLLGVRIGRRVFDDGCSMAERTLVTIGDYCTLNAGSVIQCHSMEDGIFKSDHTILEDGCTLGAGALVHYGVTMGQGSQLGPDSFLMKGEGVPPRARWGGNPARTM